MLEKILFNPENIKPARMSKWTKTVHSLILPSLCSIVGAVSSNCSEYELFEKYCVDKDHDGYGAIGCEQSIPGTYTELAYGVTPTEGYVKNAQDCQDADKNIHPHATELCNNIDDNCNGETDEYAKPAIWYKDEDGDGYGGSQTTLACPMPKKYAKSNDDCNDEKKAMHPKAKDICNLIDDNCDGVTDDYVGECKTSCGSGKLYCETGKTICDAPSPQPEICDGKDNNCNSQIDDLLIDCCIPDTIKDKKYCPDGKLKEQTVCIDFGQWRHDIFIDECVTPLYKWTCEKKVIGIVDVNASTYNFTPKQPTMSDKGSNSNQNGLPQWCCKDANGKEWGVESNPAPEYYLKDTCSCISKVSGIDDNTQNNPSKNKKSNKQEKSAFNESGKKFFEQQFQCPPHEYGREKTSIEVLFENLAETTSSVWLNWHSYGYPKSEKVSLLKNESYSFLIDERMMPADGAEIEVCTSLQGCSEKIPLVVGDHYTIEVGVRTKINDFKDNRGLTYSFQKTILTEPCLEPTTIRVLFRNHKTLDLQPWINWQQGWPVQEKVMVEPGEEYTFSIASEMLTIGSNPLTLCTSSYGCFPTQNIRCGDKKTYTIDWVFGRIGEKR